MGKAWGYQGDVIFVKIDSIPAGAKKVTPQRKSGYVLAEGEATGHAHVLTAEPGVELFERDGMLFIKNPDVAATVKHVEVDDSPTKEHKPVEIHKGTWEIRPGKEYDHFKEEANQIRD